MALRSVHSHGIGEITNDLNTRLKPPPNTHVTKMTLSVTRQTTLASHRTFMQPTVNYSGKMAKICSYNIRVRDNYFFLLLHLPNGVAGSISFRNYLSYATAVLEFFRMNSAYIFWGERVSDACNYLHLAWAIDVGMFLMGKGVWLGAHIGTRAGGMLAGCRVFAPH